LVVPTFLKGNINTIKKFNEFMNDSLGVNAFFYHEIELIKTKLGSPKVANFPAMSRAAASWIDVKPDNYIYLDEEQKELYVPLVSGTMENNQVSGYISKGKLTQKHISDAPVISWTRINPSVFFIQEKGVCTNDDSFVFVPSVDSFYKYLKYVASSVMRDLGYNWSRKAGKTIVQKIEVPIPKAIKDYSIYEVEEKIVDFFEDYLKKTRHLKSAITELKRLLPEHTQVLIYKTFTQQKQKNG